MSEMYKGYTYNDYNEKPWYNREIALFESIIDKLPAKTSKLAQTTDHYHNKVTDSFGNVNIEVRDTSKILVPNLAPGVVSVDINNELTTGAISIDASEVAYTTPYQPTVATVKDALDIIMAKLYYIAPSILSLTNDAGTVYKGQTITSVNVAWSISGTITGQSLTDCVPALSDRLHAFTGLALSTDKTYTLQIHDAITNPSSTTSTTIYFKLNKYYGQSANATPTDTIIKAALAGVTTASIDTATSRSQSIVTQAGGANYVYYSYPAAWGNVTIYVNGFLTIWNKTTVSITNTQGHTENYYCYTSANTIAGSITMNFVAA
jgi:hypothetical protein